MKHFATPNFWFYHRQLPPEVRELADKNFRLMSAEPRHPSIQLKKVGVFWSARVGRTYRALAKERAVGLVWFWIGHHSRYSQLLKSA